MSDRRSAKLAALVATGIVLVLSLPATGHAAETYQFDAIGRLIDVAYANGSSLHYTYDANGNVLSVVQSLSATAVEGSAGLLRFALGLPTPNPGGGDCRLVVTIPSKVRVTLRVFDVSGRLIATPIDRELPSGPHNVQFFTSRWAAGVYYYRLTAGTNQGDGRLVVLR